MTDATDTAATEVALRSRLATLADTATVDDEAWEKIHSRITDVRSRRRRPTARQVVALAAAVIVVVGAVLVARRDEGDRVDMVDESTTTTEGEDRDDSSSTTSTTPGESPLPTGMTPDGSPAGGQGSDGAGTDGEGSAQPGAGSTAPGQGGPAPGPAPTTSLPSSPNTMPDGQVPSVTYQASGYTLQATFWRRYSDSYFMNVYRTDRGWLTDWIHTDHPGQNCLAGESEYEFDFPEPGYHAYSWGFVRADAAQVRIVSTSGESTTAVIGSEAVPGLRPWIGRSPSGQVDRFEALDGAGNILHVARRSAGFDAQPDTC